MRPILSTTIVAILAAVSISACSSPANNAAADNSAAGSATSAAADNSASSDNTAASTASTDNTAASSDNSAAAPAAAAADVPLYPGAAPATLPSSAGPTPPGGKVFNTSDAFPKVKAWYMANVKGAQMKGGTDTGTQFLVGDAKTGSVVLLESQSGKTWILTAPQSSMK